MYHPKMQQFNKRLKLLFDDADNWLEDRYGGQYRLSPNRPERGTTSHAAHDGLFNVGPQFTAGYGSEHGRGYVVSLRISTIDELTDEKRREMELALQEKLNALLKLHFPERSLEVLEDVRGLKIVGNFNLGEM